MRWNLGKAQGWSKAVQTWFPILTANLSATNPNDTCGYHRYTSLIPEVNLAILGPTSKPNLETQSANKKYPRNDSILITNYAICSPQFG